MNEDIEQVLASKDNDKEEMIKMEMLYVLVSLIFFFHQIPQERSLELMSLAT